MKKRLITSLIAMTIISGTIPYEVFAASAESITGVYEENSKALDYLYGNYTVQNQVLKVDKDEESVARKYVNSDSTIKITNEGIKISIILNRADIMSDTVIKVDDTIVKHTERKISDKEVELEFLVESFENEIVVGTKINLGFPMSVSFRVTNDYSEIPLKPEEIKEGSYTIENETLQIDTDKESMARKYLDKSSDVEYKEGNVYLTLKFTGKSMMSNHQVEINGQNVEFQVIENSGDNFHIKFEIESLKDNIVVKTKVLGTMNVEFRVLLNEDTLVEREDIVEPPIEIPTPEPTPDPEPENPSEPEVKPEVKPEPTPPTNESTESMVYEIYKVKNEIITDSEIGYQAARNAISTTSYYEVIEGEKYITLGFSNLDLMSNVRVSVNGTNVKYEILRESASNFTMDIRFKVKDISSNIKITCFIAMMERDIDFGVDFLESTLELISKNESEKPLGSNSGTTNIVNTSQSNTVSGSKKEETVDEEIKAKSYSKKYSIENDIISNSETGRAMARKYVEKVSILEEIDGKLYLTLSFTGTDLMDNIRVNINGNEISYSLVDSDNVNNTKSIRFEISDINDEIRIYMFIKPVSMNIDFGIALLEETKILLEENNVDSKASKDEVIDNVVSEDIEDVDGVSKASTQLTSGKLMAITAASTLIIITIIQVVIYTILKRRKSKATKEQ